MATIPRQKRQKQVGHYGKGCADQYVMPWLDANDAEIRAATAQASAVFDGDTLVSVHRRPPPLPEWDGQSYEEANWPRLSPTFRQAHNRLRQARGLSTLPPPKIDEYVPPPSAIRKIDPLDPELVAAARQFVASPHAHLRGEEGFKIDGSPAKY